MIRKALISDCGKYRYWLSRGWDTRLPMCVFIMLNPSTADDNIDDMTIKKCIAFARIWGYGGFCVVNLYAWRSVSPKLLKYYKYPIGPDNDHHIKAVCDSVDPTAIIAAWGSHAEPHRVERVARGVLGDRPLKCLKILKDGMPGHPLMLPYAQERRDW
jgi:hypothetical protein